jgi:hypothetical protein
MSDTAHLPPQEPKSDLPKPKTWPAWRVVLTDFVIVVLGVGVALAAQQALEKLHETQLAREAAAVARSELRTNLQNMLRRRPTQACIERRLEEVAKLLAASNQPGYKPPSWIGRPMVEVLISAGWDAASQSGRTALLSEMEQIEFGRLYSHLRELTLLERDEQKAWAEIRQLEDQAHVDPQMRTAVRSALQQARLLNWNVMVNMEQSEARAVKLHIIDRNYRRNGSPVMCLQTGTPRAEAIAQSNKFFGDKLGEP